MTSPSEAALPRVEFMQAERIVFSANRLRAITTCTLAVMVGALGVWAMFDHPISGVILLTVAAGVIMVSLPKAVSPRSIYVQLDSSGFEVASPRDKDRVRWHDVAQIRRGFYNDRPVIEIQYVDELATLRRIHDRYNAPLDEIFATLNEWRARHGR